MPAFLPGYLLYSFNCHARRDRVVTLVEQTPDPNKHLEVVNGMIWIGKLPALEFITQPPCQAPLNWATLDTEGTAIHLFPGYSASPSSRPLTQAMYLPASVM